MVGTWQSNDKQVEDTSQDFENGNRLLGPPPPIDFILFFFFFCRLCIAGKFKEKIT